MKKNKDKDIYDLVKEFCKFADLQDNIDAELPNINTSLGQFFGNGVIEKWVKGWDFHKWDCLDDVLTTISPEFLGYILIASKHFWESKDNENEL